MPPSAVIWKFGEFFKLFPSFCHVILGVGHPVAWQHNVADSPWRIETACNRSTNFGAVISGLSVTIICTCSINLSKILEMDIYITHNSFASTWLAMRMIEHYSCYYKISNFYAHLLDFVFRFYIFLSSLSTLYILFSLLSICLIRFFVSMCPCSRWKCVRAVSRRLWR